MEWVRRTRAEHMHNVEKEEENTVESANLEILEVKRGEWRALCSLENRFSALMNDGDEDMTTTRRQRRRQSYHRRTMTGFLC